MGRIFIDPNDRATYILKEDREQPAEKQTRFQLKVLSVREFEGRKDVVRYTDEGGMIQVRAGTWIYETLRLGLVGWEGPEAPPFEVGRDGRITDECMSKLHPDVRRELSTAIDELNSPKDEDLKD